MDLDDGDSRRFPFLFLPEDARWHPERGVDSSVVVVAHLLMHRFDQLSNMVEALETAQFELEA